MILLSYKIIFLCSSLISLTGCTFYFYEYNAWISLNKNLYLYILLILVIIWLLFLICIAYIFLSSHNLKYQLLPTVPTTCIIFITYYKVMPLNWENTRIPLYSLVIINCLLQYYNNIETRPHSFTVKFNVKIYM